MPRLSRKIAVKNPHALMARVSNSREMLFSSGNPSYVDIFYNLQPATIDIIKSTK